LSGVYGTDGDAIDQLSVENPDMAGLIHPALPYRNSEVVWSVRYEMARTLADVLSRRLRALILDARAAVEAAPGVAAVLAAELGKDSRWIQEQVASFRKLARNYIVR
jgi:glycerol-3-phosphate dehydrogenase